MATTRSTRKPFKLDNTLYAAVGAGDLAVEYARGAASDVQTRLGKLQDVDLEPKAVRDQALTRLTTRVTETQAALESRLAGLQADAKALPDRVEKAVNGYVTELNKTYAQLASRGESFVARVRGQEATKQTASAAKTTATKAKTTKTQSKKTAKTAGSSAKATGTSAKKTASAAKKATGDAASKAGS